MHRALALRRSTTPILAILILAFMRAASQQPVREDAEIARAGNTFISEHEFHERFELTPGLYRHGKSQLENEKVYFLYSMIAEKLLAQEALSRKLDEDSLFQLAMLELTKLLARDQLYRHEVTHKVKVSPKEVQRGMKQAVEQRLVSFLFFPNEEDARFVRAQLKKPDDFGALRIDTTLDFIRDTATVIWGDADTLIETAAYNLHTGEISPVIQSGDGYYILRLSDVKTNDAYASLNPDVLREQVTSRLRQRKERARALAFIREVTKGKAGYSPPDLFERFSDRVATLYAKETSPPRSTMTREMAVELLQSCTNDLHDTLIVAGSTAWTVQEVIGRLLQKSFTVAPNAVKRIPRRLYESFEEWVHQELLAQEALKRGLDRLPDVQEQFKPWRDQYLAFMMKERTGRGIEVSDAEIFAYLEASGKNPPVPQVRVRELRTTSLEQMGEALSELEQGVPFSDVIVRRSTDEDGRTRGGVSEFFPITARPPIGDLASRMDIGQRFGPVQDTAGFVLFELVAKKDTLPATDTTFQSRREEARWEVLRMKKKRILTLFLSQIAAQRGFEIYEERLRQLKVTPIPMLAYRLLGFGGRMFVVPFVDRQVEWLDVEPPETTIVP